MPQQLPLHTDAAAEVSRGQADGRDALLALLQGRRVVPCTWAGSSAFVKRKAQRRALEGVLLGLAGPVLRRLFGPGEPFVPVRRKDRKAFEVERLRELAAAGALVPRVFAVSAGAFVMESLGCTLEQEVDSEPARARELLLLAAGDLAQFHAQGHWHGGAQIRNMACRQGRIARFDFDRAFDRYFPLPMLQALDVALPRQRRHPGGPGRDTGRCGALLPARQGARAVGSRARPALGGQAGALFLDASPCGERGGPPVRDGTRARLCPAGGGPLGICAAPRRPCACGLSLVTVSGWMKVQQCFHPGNGLHCAALRRREGYQGCRLSSKTADYAGLRPKGRSATVCTPDGRAHGAGRSPRHRPTSASVVSCRWLPWCPVILSFERIQAMNHEHLGEDGHRSGRRSIKDAARHAIECDDARASMPYEHCATMTAGIALIVGALLTPRRELAVAQGVAAGFLLFRSLSGRDGLRRWVGANAARPHDDPLAEERSDEPGYSGA